MGYHFHRRMESRVGALDTNNLSILEKFIVRNGPDSTVPFVMSNDMISAGIDNTASTIAFLLYNLAVNQEKQACDELYIF
jgi:hypothetical protein